MPMRQQDPDVHANMDRSKTSSSSSSASATSSSLPCSPSQPCGVLRLVVGISLCLSVAVVTAAPAAPSPSQPIATRDVYDPLDDVYNNQQTLTFLDLLRSALAYKERMDEHAPLVAGEMGFSGMDNTRPVKRGFGIAGLDNVDMITSTLDRSRAMSRSRYSPMMSSGLTLKQLRALMERAG